MSPVQMTKRAFARSSQTAGEVWEAEVGSVRVATDDATNSVIARSCLLINY